MLLKTLLNTKKFLDNEILGYNIFLNHTSVALYLFPS
jgi:hypothetical protein